MAVIWRDSAALYRLTEKKYLEDMVRLTDDYPVGFLQEPENMYKYTQYKSNELFPQTRHSCRRKNYDVTVFSRYGDYFDCNPISTRFRTKFGRSWSSPDISNEAGPQRTTRPTSVDTRLPGSLLSTRKNQNGSRCSGKVSITRRTFPKEQNKTQIKDISTKNNHSKNEVWYRKSHVNDGSLQTPDNKVDHVDRRMVLKRLTRDTESSKQKRTTFLLSKRNDKTDSKLRKFHAKEAHDNKFVKGKINLYDVQDMVDRLSMCSPFKRYSQQLNEEVQ